MLRTRARRAALLCAAVLVSGGCVEPAATGDTRPERSAAARTSASATASPTSSPTATPTPAEQRLVDAVLTGMSREEQVSQLFLVGVPLADLGRAGALVADGVGGIFLAGRSGIPAAELAGRTAAWQSAAGRAGLWVAVDQEGGQVQTLSGPGFPALPRAQEQGRLPAPQLRALADDLGAALASAGVNLNLAPVADVVPAGTEAANPPIGAYGRHYGATAEEVRAAAGTVVAALAAHGVTATLKHFPGLGRVTANTDDTAGVVDEVTTAGSPEVATFGRLAGSRHRPFVMTSSATYARIDGSAPAAWSAVVVDGLLRDELGFDGVVVSDDLGAARAVQSVPPGQRATWFLAAGGTLVLTVVPDLLPEMRAAVLARDRADPAFRARVDAAVRTALLAKARAGLLTG